MKKILILSGGYSKEREISIKTGNEVAKALKKKNIKLKYSIQKENLLIKLENINQMLYLMLYMVDTVKMDIFKPYLKMKKLNIHTLV